MTTRAEFMETPIQRERAMTIFEKSKPGRRAAQLPAAGVPEPPLDELIPAKLLRSELPRLPEIAEPEIVLHYNRLSRRNFDRDSGFYPLGRDYPEFPNGLLVAITEQRTRADIDRLASTLQAAVREAVPA